MKRRKDLQTPNFDKKSNYLGEDQKGEFEQTARRVKAYQSYIKQ